jgi:hypothetical protein
MSFRSLASTFAFFTLIACDRQLSEPPSGSNERVATPQIRHLVADPASPFGINLENIASLQSAGVRTMDLVQEAGVGWIRAGIRWNLLEPVDIGGGWNTSSRYYQEIVQTISLARARGLNVYITIMTDAPSWANGNNSLPQYPALPTHYDKWGRFVARALTVFGPMGVRDWSIGNEPNALGHFNPHGRPWLDVYEELLVPAADSIHAYYDRQVDRSHRVIGYELAYETPLLPAIRASLHRMVGSKTIGDRMQVVAVHHYQPAHVVYEAMTDSVAHYVPELRQGGRWELWLTETGVSDPQPGDERSTRNHLARLYMMFLHKHDMKPPAQQRSNWRKIFYYAAVSSSSGEADEYPLIGNFWRARDCDPGPQCEGVNDPSLLDPREGYWTLRYLGRTYQQLYSVGYSAYIHANGAWTPERRDNIAWGGPGTDYAGTVGQSKSIWGMEAHLNPDLDSAGVSICYAVRLDAIGELNNGGGGFCDGHRIEPQLWGTQSHAMQSMWVRLNGALPDSSPAGVMRVCYQVHVAGTGWQSGFSCEGAHAPSSTSMPALEAFRVWLDGDIY